MAAPPPPLWGCPLWVAALKLDWVGKPESLHGLVIIPVDFSWVSISGTEFETLRVKTSPFTFFLFPNYRKALHAGGHPSTPSVKQIHADHCSSTRAAPLRSKWCLSVLAPCLSSKWTRARSTHVTAAAEKIQAAAPGLFQRQEELLMATPPSMSSAKGTPHQWSTVAMWCLVTSLKRGASC